MLVAQLGNLLDSWGRFRQLLQEFPAILDLVQRLEIGNESNAAVQPCNLLFFSRRGHDLGHLQKMLTHRAVHGQGGT
ncbi:hypothetical protein D3C78_1518330 [compost metagenome]